MPWLETRKRDRKELPPSHSLIVLSGLPRGTHGGIRRRPPPTATLRLLLRTMTHISYVTDNKECVILYVGAVDGTWFANRVPEAQNSEWLQSGRERESHPEQGCDSFFV